MKASSRIFGRKTFAGMLALLLVCALIIPMAGLAASAKSGIFYPDFTSIEEAHEYGEELNAKIVEEGAVLMKNENGALPLSKGAGVSIVGWQSHDMIAGGSGSGGSASIKVTLPAALTNVGLKVNQRLENYYATHTPQKVNMPLGMFGGTTATTVETDPSELEALESSYALYNTAIFTISRGGGEGSDLPTSSTGSAMQQVNADPTKHYMQLFDKEIEMVNYLKELKAKGSISKIVILVNTVAAFELAPLQDDEDIDAILWIGQPSTHGLQGVANLLAGIANPSGRTVDIWDANHKADPTWQNFGDNTQNGLENNNAYVDEATKDNDIHVVEYEEGIYLGYKWYETAAADGILTKLPSYDKSAFDPSAESDKAYYNRSNGVIYPFGYGLSYTTFSQKLLTTGEEIAQAVNNLSGLDDVIDVQVKVTNIGEKTGKDVVELYVHAPYTKDGIEKAEVALVGIAKTAALRPGDSQIVTVTVRVGDIASFDDNDANKNGYKGWEIEAGEYEFRLQKNSHEVIEVVKSTLEAKTTSLDNDADNANNAPFSQGDVFDTTHNYDGNAAMKTMSRADFVATFPKAPAITDRIFSADMLALMKTADSIAAGDHEGANTRYHGYTNSSDDLTTDPWFVVKVPDGWTQAANTDGRTNGKTAIQMKDMAGIDYRSKVALTAEDTTVEAFIGKTGEQAWEIFLNQLTWQELTALLQRGQYQTPGLDSVGKITATDQDGPAQLQGGISMPAATVVASTWNVELAYEYGRIIGNDSLFLGIPGWYAPAMNIHRSPFSGRNFEYFSQDALLSGLIAAPMCKGYQDLGGYVFIKHYAINDQETDRIGISTYATEQSMRENYLKTFELSVKEGGALAVMTSFNHVGAINSFGNYHLLTTVLRNEWGFAGEIVTDYYMQPASKFPMILRAGGELLLGTANGNNAIKGTWDASLRGGKGGVREGTAEGDVVPESATQYAVVRNAAMHVLYVGANTNVNRNGLDLSAFKAQTFSLEANLAANVSVAADPAALGSENVIYEITGGTLPEGLNFNKTTGAISGTPTKLGSSNVNVKMTVDGWITSTQRITVNVTPNITVKAGDPIDKELSLYKVGDTIITQGWWGPQTQTITAVDPPVLSDTSLGLTVGDDSHLTGSIATPGIYTLNITQQAYYGRNNRVNVSVSYLVYVTDAEGNVPSIDPSAVVPSADNPVVFRVQNGQVQYAVYTAPDAEAVWNNLIALSDLTGAAGAAGAAGKNGQDGRDGEIGPRGVGIAGVSTEKNDGVTKVTLELTNGETATFEIADGAAGAAGAQGAQGAQGEKGEKGDTGATGATGAAGAAGEAASAGAWMGVVAIIGCVLAAAAICLAFVFGKKKA